MVFASVFADSSRNYIYFDPVTWAGQITLQISSHLISKSHPNWFLCQRLLNWISVPKYSLNFSHFSIGFSLSRGWYHGPWLSGGDRCGGMLAILAVYSWRRQDTGLCSQLMPGVWMSHFVTDFVLPKWGDWTWGWAGMQSQLWSPAGWPYLTAGRADIIPGGRWS